MVIGEEGKPQGYVNFRGATRSDGIGLRNVLFLDLRVFYADIKC